MFCTNCGTLNKEEEEFCIQCGESLAEPEIRKEPFSERMLKKAGLLRALFDFSFSEFVTPKIAKFLYILSILYAVLLTLLCIIIGFNVSIGFGIFILIIVGPLMFLLTVIYGRVFLEISIVVLRIAHYTAEIIKKSGSKDGIQWQI